LKEELEKAMEEKEGEQQKKDVNGMLGIFWWLKIIATRYF